MQYPAIKASSHQQKIYSQHSDQENVQSQIMNPPQSDKNKKWYQFSKDSFRMSSMSFMPSIPSIPYISSFNMPSFLSFGSKQISLKEALEIFQLSEKDLNIKSIEWVYKAKKSYYSKYKQQQFYEKKLKKLEQSYLILKKKINVS